MKKLFMVAAATIMMLGTASAQYSPTFGVDRQYSGPCIKEGPRITGQTCVGSGDKCYCADLTNECASTVILYYDRVVPSRGKVFETKKLYFDPFEHMTDLCTTSDGTDHFRFLAELPLN